MIIYTRAMWGITVTVASLFIAGCGGTPYWVKRDATAADFYRDSRECAQGAATEAAYKHCLQTRGYQRQELTSPPTYGWRGLTDEGDGSKVWTNYPKPLNQEEFAKVSYECQRDATMAVRPIPDSYYRQPTPTPSVYAPGGHAVVVEPYVSPYFQQGAVHGAIVADISRRQAGLLAACLNAHGYRLIDGYEAKRIRLLRATEMEK